MKSLLPIFSIILIVGCSSTNNLNQSIVHINDKGEISLNYDKTEDGYDMLLETSDPVALRTLLMQGFNLYICENGSDTTIVSFPSAKDVSQEMEHHPGEVKAMIKDNREKRPDIRPLLAALNKAKISITYKGKTQSLGNRHEISVSPSNGVLSYSFIIPSECIGDSRPKVTLISQPRNDMLITDEFTSQGYISRSPTERQQPFGIDAERDTRNPQKIVKIDFEF